MRNLRVTWLVLSLLSNDGLSYLLLSKCCIFITELYDLHVKNGGYQELFRTLLKNFFSEVPSFETSSWYVLTSSVYQVS